jgi:hypothetical protein
MLEGLQLGVILSLMERTVMKKLSDGKEQRWQEQRNREVSKLVIAGKNNDDKDQ